MEVIIKMFFVNEKSDRRSLCRTSILIIYFVPFCQNRLRGSGHGIAAARMDAKLNAAGWMSEKMGGLRLEYYDSLMIY